MRSPRSSRHSNNNNGSNSADEHSGASSSSYAGGESGPRRLTIEEPVDTAAANAEAYRMARALGVASSNQRRGSGSSSGNNHNYSSSGLSWSNVWRGSAMSSRPGNIRSPQRQRQQHGSDAATTTSSSYVRMQDDMAGDGSIGTHSSTSRVSRYLNNDPVMEAASRDIDSCPSYNSRKSSDPRPHKEPPLQSQDEIHVYDAHGQRAPYKEGPYHISREKDGRVIKKRWYGRMEDGYLAWSSIYLHEYFGFTIYTPLTTQEEQELKKPGGKIPRWMYEFTSLPNLAIPMSYFCIGVALQLLRTPLIVYFISDLGATAAEVNVLFTVMAVPWCFKVIYGFLSDCLPISGLRRKPYFMTGWLVYIASNLILMVTPFPSIQLCILLVFTQTAGYMLADVMTDALIVERSRFESQEKRGTMQSVGYIIRFFGSTIGAVIGAIVYNKHDWNWYLPIRLVFFINAAFPMIFLVPFVPYLLELDTNCQPKNFYKQCQELFATAQLRAVWQPMTFVYIYNALQLTNAAWMNFLIDGLDFSAWMIGLVSIVGSIMAWFGIMTYKRFFFASNWRIVYFWCTTLASLIALGQLILVFGINRDWGIPDIWFSMGDDVLVEFVIAVQFLPMCIMYLGLCPPGSEGTTYAMLTTWSNLAGSLAFDISTALTVVWDVRSSTIKSGDYSGVWKLSLLCGLIGPLPLVLLSLIPRNKEDQSELQRDTSRHWGAGVTFITVMILTLIVTFVESIYEVYFNDESDKYDNQRRLSRLMVGH